MTTNREEKSRIDSPAFQSRNAAPPSLPPLRRGATTFPARIALIFRHLRASIGDRRADRQKELRLSGFHGTFLMLFRKSSLKASPIYRERINVMRRLLQLLLLLASIGVASCKGSDCNESHGAENSPGTMNASSFLSNSLEQQKDRTFKPIGPAPHFGPPPLPITPGQEILFKPFFLPEKRGKYRVKVAYFDDAEIYKLIVEKTPNWTDDELRTILAAWTYVWSDAFDIR